MLCYNLPEQESGRGCRLDCLSVINENAAVGLTFALKAFLAASPVVRDTGEPTPTNEKREKANKDLF